MWRFISFDGLSEAKRWGYKGVGLDMNPAKLPSKLKMWCTAGGDLFLFS